MKPREENPKVYRENIHKSWKVMLSVVQKISNESYIQHLEPNAGAGYDCLSLVTKDPYGQWQPIFLLNRNGENGLANGLVERLWKRSETESGIEELANLLIEQTGLSRANGKPQENKSVQICTFVCKWIDDHVDQNFSVAPPGWPEGCRGLNNQFSQIESLNWPTEMENRYVILGVNSQEELRIDLADGSVIRNEKNLNLGTLTNMNVNKKALSKYAQERLGHYVYALRDPRDQKIFYVGKGVNDRVLAHANGMIGNDDPKSMKEQTIREIHSQGLEVDAWIIQSGLKDHEHAFATESAVYGTLKLLDPSLEAASFALTNIVVPPSFHETGLIQLEEAIALFGEPADSQFIPHNSVFIKPTTTWRRGMKAEELWEATHGWWILNEKRISEIKYVIAIPNFVIRGVWEVPVNGWRKQAPGDRGFKSSLDRKPRFGFDAMNDVSQSKFPNLMNKSVEHLYTKKGQKQASCTYLDDLRVVELKKQGRTPFWNVGLR